MPSYSTKYTQQAHSKALGGGGRRVPTSQGTEGGSTEISFPDGVWPHGVWSPNLKTLFIDRNIYISKIKN